MKNFNDFTPKTPTISSNEKYPENVKTSPEAMKRLTEVSKSSDEIVIGESSRVSFSQAMERRGGVRDLCDAYNDPTPLREMILKPGILPEGGLLVVVGAPKVGKTDYLISGLAHWCAGKEFLGVTPDTPKSVLYVQAEVDYDTMRTRIKYMGITKEMIAQTKGRFKFTPRFQECYFDAKTLEEVVEYCNTVAFPDAPPDLICVDPLSNVWDSSDGQHENDNGSMTKFVNNLRSILVYKINPKAGLILVHHAVKQRDRVMTGASVFDDIAGASSLRRAYDACIFITMADPKSETNHDRIIHFETRCSVSQVEELNAPSIMTVYKDAEGAWQIREDEVYNLDKRAASLRDARDATNQKLLDYIYEEAMHGRIYELDPLCKTLEDKMGLGGYGSIKARISTLTHKWLIKFTQSAYKHGDFPKYKGNGHLVVYDMKDQNGNIIFPTHMTHRTSNTLIEVPTKGIWELKD